MWFYLIAGLTYLFAMVVTNRMKATHRKWSRVRNSANVTGAWTAQAILLRNDLRQVRLLPGRGELTDHYDPDQKTIRLSEPVFAVPSVAAMAIAAHEAGHAIQDAVGYRALRLRTSMAPLAQAGARFGLPAAVIGMLTGSDLFLQVGVLVYAGAFLFQLVTLPVEFDASKRALENLEALDLLDENEDEAARGMLRAAAMTYVAGVASSAGYILYLLAIGGRWLLRRPAPPKPPPTTVPPAP